MKKAGLFSFIFLYSVLVHAQVNDNCANAIPLTNLTKFCSSPSAYTTVGATDEGIPLPTGCWVPLGTVNDVWFSFVATGTLVNISVNPTKLPKPSPKPTAQLALYSGTCGALTQEGCGRPAVIDSFLTVGNTYFIRVDMTGSTTDSFSLCIDNRTPFLNPQGDCIGATNLCSKDPVPSTTVDGPGFVQEGQQSCLNVGNKNVEVNSIWYTWTCDTAGTLEFYITPSLSDDIDFALYQLAPDCNNLVNLRCNAASCKGAGNLGVTGLDSSATADSLGAGCPKGASPFSNPVNLISGITYALQINNFSANRGFTITFAGTATFVSGQKASFTVSPTTGCIMPGTPITFTNTSVGALTCNWTFGPDASIPSFTGQTPPPITYNSPGTYTVTLDVQTAQGCTGTTSQTIVIGPSTAAPVVTSPISYCQGATALPLAATGSSLLWYTVSTGGTGSSTAPTPDTSVPSSTTYYVSQTIGGCESARVPIVVDVSNSATVTINSDTICEGDTAVLTATPSVSGGTYAWTPGGATTATISVTPKTTTIYSCTYSFTSCSGSGGATVTVNSLPVISLTPDTDLCAGSSITLTAGGANTYTWNPGGATGSSLNIIPPVTTTYTVNASDLNLCKASNQVTVTIHQPPVADAGADVTICDGDQVLIHASTNSSWQYSWDPVSDLSDATIANPVFSGNDTSTFVLTVSVANSVCPPSTDTVTINVINLPLISAGSDSSIHAGESVQLNAITSSAAVVNWFPRTSLSCDNCLSPIATPQVTTIYTVTATENGCSSSDAVIIKVEEIFSFYIPASFSKNPASINRIFRAYGVGVKDFEFYVFNRWGDVVFQTTDLEKGWDGLIDGAPASDDVYVYFAKAYSASGKSISKSGTVTIID